MTFTSSGISLQFSREEIKAGVENSIIRKAKRKMRMIPYLSVDLLSTTSLPMAK
jgi:hypothetical protein